MRLSSSLTSLQPSSGLSSRLLRDSSDSLLSLSLFSLLFSYHMRGNEISELTRPPWKLKRISFRLFPFASPFLSFLLVLSKKKSHYLISLVTSFESRVVVLPTQDMYILNKQRDTSGKVVWHEQTNWRKDIFHVEINISTF